MLIVYNKSNGSVVSISGFREIDYLSKESIDSIKLVDPLPEGQAEYKIYDISLINKIWDAFDRGAVLTVVLDENGNPVGVMADGVMIV